MSNEIKICGAYTLKGKTCKRRRRGVNQFCFTHRSYKFNTDEFGKKPEIENFEEKKILLEQQYGKSPRKIKSIKDHIISKTNNKEKKQPNWFKRQYIKFRVWWLRNMMWF